MYIVGISIDKRKEAVPEVQSVLSEYGNHITTRLGIHDEEKENKGVIITAYQKEDVDEFVEKLNSIEAVEANYMEL